MGHPRARACRAARAHPLQPLEPVLRADAAGSRVLPRVGVEDPARRAAERGFLRPAVLPVFPRGLLQAFRRVRARRQDRAGAARHGDRVPHLHDRPPHRRRAHGAVGRRRGCRLRPDVLPLARGEDDRVQKEPFLGVEALDADAPVAPRPVAIAELDPDLVITMWLPFWRWTTQPARSNAFRAVAPGDDRELRQRRRRSRPCAR